MPAQSVAKAAKLWLVCFQPLQWIVVQSGIWRRKLLQKKKMRNDPTSAGPFRPLCGPRARPSSPSPLILAVWALAAAVWPLTGSVVPWDSKNQFYPTLRYLGAALAHGELPLWNPYHFGGHPSAADPQSLLFTPTMLLFGWLVPEAVDAALRRAWSSRISCPARWPSCRCSAGAAGIRRARWWPPSSSCSAARRRPACSIRA